LLSCGDDSAVTGHHQGRERIKADRHVNQVRRYYFGTTTGRISCSSADSARVTAQISDSSDALGRLRESYDLFEGTEQIQQLVIARAISGLRIE
jgi:hypothetical protein